MNTQANPETDTMELKAGSTQWSSPSNIALVKYWGKHGIQLPRNASVSFTLDTARTDMRIDYRPKKGKGISLDFLFEGKAMPEFAARMERTLANLVPVFPFLEQLELRMESSNTFPHSAGIASSAAAMSALALNLCQIERNLYGRPLSDEEFLAQASNIARLGSGSACRSVYPHLAAWGLHPEISGSSDEYAVDCGADVDPVFHTYHDSILIASGAEKSVSSSAGHQLMEGNPYADARYRQANDQLGLLMKAMAAADLDEFGRIVENEALTLHALMMSSNPSYILMNEASLSMIRLIRGFREETGLPLYFTLDAGPNIHLLYPDEIAGRVQDFMQAELKPLCENGRIIEDRVGNGPVNKG